MKNRFVLWSVLIALLAAAGLGAAQSGPAELSPDAWFHEGDSDGDGLTDAFEEAHGLDPHLASSFADGTPDELRLDSSGKTMWEVQESEKAASAGSRSGACGATGLELLAFMVLIRGMRRSFRRPA